MTNNEEQPPIFNNLDTALTALKAFTNDVDPKLASTEMFNNMLRAAPIISQKQQITKSTFNKALLSLGDARDDIKASKLLFDGKIYSRSVYSLQQSVEKACKAFGLALGFIENQKSIGHQSPDIFLKMFEDQSSINYYIPLLEQYTQENQRIKIEKAKEALSKKRRIYCELVKTALIHF
jgi:hypothetical protein